MIPLDDLEPEYEQPASGAVLWRYMDVTKLLSMLTTEQLFFASPAQFNDVYEGVEHRVIESVKRQNDLNLQFHVDCLGGVVPAERVAELEEWRRDSTDVIRKSLLVLNYERSLYNVSCWHNHEHESAAMWRAYTQTSEGIAIKSTFGQVLSEIQKADNPERLSLRAANVVYELHSTPDNAVIAMTELLLHKHPSFHSEHETRFLLYGYARALTPKALDEATKSNQLEWLTKANVRTRAVKVKIANIINEIVVSPAAQSWVTETISEIVRTLGFSFPVRPSVHSVDPYHLIG